MAFCDKCGKELRTGAKFCEECGAVVEGKESPSQTATVGLPQRVRKLEVGR